ncbi:MAG: outer membrane lipoprotein carrier protein LolA [Elusimicrobiota bacterium]
MKNAEQTQNKVQNNHRTWQLVLLITVLPYYFISCLYSAMFDEILKKMDEADSKIADVSFSFIQEILVTITQEKSAITGTAVFKKPDMFKIEHSKPEKQVVISDGKKVFFYQKEFNQVIIDDWESLSETGNFPKGIFNFSSTITGLTKNYNISLLDDEEKYYVLVLELKEKQLQNTKIQLWISKETYLCEKTEIKTDTVVSTVTISDVKINKNIKDSIFKFKIPKGTQIITFPF